MTAVLHSAANSTNSFNRDAQSRVGSAVLCWLHVPGRVLRGHVHLSMPARFSLAYKHAFGR